MDCCDIISFIDKRRGQVIEKISIFIDDSGVFHSNHNYFVYAGFCFISDEDKISAKKRYRSLNTKIKQSKGIEGEA